jgi:hypothetical protein
VDVAVSGAVLDVRVAKSDPDDALVLAELARTDAHNHRPVAGGSVLAEAVKALAQGDHAAACKALNSAIQAPG